MNPAASTARLVAVLLLLASVTANARAEDHEEEKVRAELMGSYNPHARPSIKTVVQFRNVHIRDLSMDEEHGLMSLKMWLSMMWQDSRLSWSEQQYPHIDRLGFPPQTVWIPDLTVYNSAEAEKQLLDGSRMQVLAYSNGTIIHVPSNLIDFTCIFDHTYWPFDTQTCTAKIGSWVYSVNHIDLQPITETLEVDLKSVEGASGQTLRRSEWKVLSARMLREEKHYSCCPEAYVSVSIVVEVARDAPTYCWMVKIPGICLTLLTLVLFLLPPGASEKIGFGGLCMILQLIFLSYVTNVISHSPSHTPLIVQLAAQQMVVVVVGVLVAALVVRMARNPHPLPPPAFVRRPVLNLARLLCLNDYVRMVSCLSDGAVGGGSTKADEGEVELGGEVGEGGRRGAENEAARHQWVLLAALLDRLALIVYLLLAVITLCRFSAVL